MRAWWNGSRAGGRVRRTMKHGGPAAATQKNIERLREEFFDVATVLLIKTSPVLGIASAGSSLSNLICGRGGMADTIDLGSIAKSVQVQVLSPAPNSINPNLLIIGNRFGFIFSIEQPNFNLKNIFANK